MQGNNENKSQKEIDEINEAINLLKETVCFMIFHFEDKSSMFILTTLNAEILKEFGAEIRPDSFFDLIKHRYMKFRKDACSVEVNTDDVRVREVDMFANRYV